MFLKEQHRKSLFVSSGYLVIKENNKMYYFFAATLIRIKHLSFKRKCATNDREEFQEGSTIWSSIRGLHRGKRECHLGDLK